jgi:hypothetical protein
MDMMVTSFKIHYAKYYLRTNQKHGQETRRGCYGKLVQIEPILRSTLVDSKLPYASRANPKMIHRKKRTSFEHWTGNKLRLL